MPPVKAILTAIGGFLVFLTIGTNLTWGNLDPYVISYVRKRSSPSTVTYGDTLWVPCFARVGVGCSILMGGLIEKRLGPRLTTALGATIFSSSILLSGFALRIHYYLFVFTYGLVYGIGAGITYAAPITLVIKWFKKSPGVGAGIVAAGMGGTGVIFDQVQTLYINPDNKEAVQVNSTGGDTSAYFTDDGVLDRVPSLFWVIAGIYAVMQAIGVVLIIPLPKENVKVEVKDDEKTPLLKDSDAPAKEQNGVAASNGIHQDGISDSGESSSADASTSSKDDSESKEEEMPTRYWNIPVKEAVKTRPFITLWIMFFLNCNVVTILANLYKTFGTSEVIDDDKFLAILGSVSAVGNSIGRFSWGVFTDKVNFRMASILMGVFVSFLSCTLYLSHTFAEQAGKPLLLIWVTLLFLSFSGSFAIFPVAVNLTFGPKHSAIMLGLLLTCEILNGPISALISSCLLQYIGFFGLFIISGVMSAISAALGVSFNVKKDGKYV